MKMHNVFVLLVCFLFISSGMLKGCAGGSSDNPAAFKAICAVLPDDDGEPESDDCSSGGIGSQTLNLATQRSTSPGGEPMIDMTPLHEPSTTDSHMLPRSLRLRGPGDISAPRLQAYLPATE